MEGYWTVTENEEVWPQMLCLLSTKLQKALEKYKESHKKLSRDFRSNEPAFKDVDDVFISATLETLFEIIKKVLSMNFLSN